MKKNNLTQTNPITRLFSTFDSTKKDDNFTLLCT
jgi:hypothetical protein